MASYNPVGRDMLQAAELAKNETNPVRGFKGIPPEYKIKHNLF